MLKFMETLFLKLLSWTPVYFGIFWGVSISYIIFLNFCNFFQNCLTPGGPWGGPMGLGGAPPRGYPTWGPSSNILNILRFWNILE